MDVPPKNYWIRTFDFQLGEPVEAGLVGEAVETAREAPGELLPSARLLSMTLMMVMVVIMMILMMILVMVVIMMISMMIIVMVVIVMIDDWGDFPFLAMMMTS